MKRYRVLGMSFDTRARILSQEIGEGWEDNVRDSWVKNKEGITKGLIDQYGILDADQKKHNFVELDVMPFSVIAFHNRFLTDCRNAFTIGAYYPALTGVCSLGERILNQLVLLLRDDYKATPEYQRVFRKDSFDNWKLMINTLSSWKVLLPAVTEIFRKLEPVRNRSLHYTANIEANDRFEALKAIYMIQEIVRLQFGFLGSQPWLISNIPGEVYIKKEFEKDPFVREIYIPNCALVGPKHSLDRVDGEWIVRDEFIYDNTDLDDELYAQMRKNR